MASKTVTLKNNNGDQIHPKTKANAVFLEDGQNVENKFKTIVANDINYNPENSGMQVNNVQDAIDELFTSASNGKQIIADAITGKGVPTSANDTYATMAENVEKIEAGVDISDTTLTLPEEMKEGVIAYNKTGDKIIGSLKEIQLLEPLISLNTSDGIITSTSIISSKGIINESTTTKTYQLTTQAGTTITPGASQKIAVATGKYTTGPVYVAGDSDLVSSNIKNGVSIFGIQGEFFGLPILNDISIKISSSGAGSIGITIEFPLNDNKYNVPTSVSQLGSFMLHFINSRSTTYDPYFNVLISYDSIRNRVFLWDGQGHAQGSTNIVFTNFNNSNTSCQFNISNPTCIPGPYSEEIFGIYVPKEFS